MDLLMTKGLLNHGGAVLFEISIRKHDVVAMRVGQAAFESWIEKKDGPTGTGPPFSPIWPANRSDVLI